MLRKNNSNMPLLLSIYWDDNFALQIHNYFERAPPVFFWCKIPPQAYRAITCGLWDLAPPVMAPAALPVPNVFEVPITE
jgi:hypothetical protein